MYRKKKGNDSRVRIALETRELRHVENQSRQLAEEENSHDHQEDQGEALLSGQPFSDNISF